MKYQKINWNPWQNNPLDYLYWRTEHKLVSAGGQDVKISQSGIDFIVTIGDERIATGGNTETCYVLNQREVGIRQ